MAEESEVSRPGGIGDAVAADPDGVILTIDVSAGSKKDRFPAGYNEWRKAIQCHIRAPPVEGRANKAIVACIASQMGVGRREIAIISGLSSSVKRVLIRGISRDEAIERVTLLMKTI
jgi:uncharacterized protein (TIGR00251 family)